MQLEVAGASDDSEERVGAGSWALGGRSRTTLLRIRSYAPKSRMRHPLRAAGDVRAAARNAANPQQGVAPACRQPRHCLHACKSGSSSRERASEGVSEGAREGASEGGSEGARERARERARIVVSQ